MTVLIAHDFIVIGGGPAGQGAVKSLPSMG